MAQIIALCNQKGGVGKTTTAINLCSALAERDKRVLAVDLDPQAALTAWWGLPEDTGEASIYTLLLNSQLDSAGVIRQVRPQIDVLPGEVDLAAAEIELYSLPRREHVLAGLLKSVEPAYDFVLIDCPPNLGLLTINALVASNGIIIPLQCEFLAMRGLGLLLETLARVKRRLNPRLEVLGILPTLYDVRTRHGAEVLEEVRNIFGDRVFDTVIRSSIRFAECAVAHLSILEYEPRHPGAEAYRALAEEVLNGRS